MIGEARRARQVVKVVNSEGKVVYAKPRFPMVGLQLSFPKLFSYFVFSTIFEDCTCMLNLSWQKVVIPPPRNRDLKQKTLLHLKL